MLFEYLIISVAQKLAELQIFGSNIWKTYFFGKMIFLDNWFCPTDLFVNSFRFGQLIFDNSLFYLSHFIDQLNF